MTGFIFYQLFIKRRGEFHFDITGKETSPLSLSPAQFPFKLAFMSRLTEVIRTGSEGNIRFPDEGQSMTNSYTNYLYGNR